MLGKYATMVSPLQERAMLGSLATTRSPARHHVLLLVSIKAGLRATAMASLTWAMVTDAQGQVTEVRHVPTEASHKGALKHGFAGARALIVAGHGLRVCTSASPRGGPCHGSSPRVLHAEVLWTGLHSNLFVTLPSTDACCPSTKLLHSLSVASMA